MSVKLRTKLLPFDNETSLPQRLKFKHKNSVYEVEYRINSHDSHLYMSLRTLRNYKKIYSCRLVEGSTHYIYETRTGEILFILFVAEIKEDDVKIYILDEDFVIE